MSRTQKQTLFRIILSAVLLLCIALLPVEGALRLGLFLIPYLIIGWDVLWEAIQNILRGQWFDENFLMAIATVGAFCIGEYPEGVFVMLFYQVGELFQSLAVERSRNSIADLMNMMPEYANLEENQSLREVDPSEVEIGQIIVIKPGEKVPLDGTVVEGESSLNTMALTGEAVPRDVFSGDEVISGCVNLTGLLRLRVSRRFEDSTVSRILELVESSAANKAKTENFITRFARYYTPVVVLAALALAVIPSLLWGGWSTWVYRALSFLVISCPCALVLSVPLSFFGGIGGASKRGILVKGATYLESLSKAEVVAFDKTGTLTKGSFSVSEIVPEPSFSKEKLLEFAALAELYSDHPIAVSLRAAVPDTLEKERVGSLQNFPGRGVLAIVDGMPILAGNQKLMSGEGISVPQIQNSNTVVYLAVNQEYAGYIRLADEVKEHAAQALQRLHRVGIQKTVMLTGDNSYTAQEIGNTLGIDAVYSQLLPQDKVSCLEKLLNESAPNRTVVFVGDGINDAPVLSRADVGIAMGGLGSDAAMEAADVVIMDDDPQKVATAILIAKRTMRIARENIVFSLAIKGLVLALSMIGLSNMWEAVLADVGVSVVAILNATRTLSAKEK